jgi:hypothetical protein
MRLVKLVLISIVVLFGVTTFVFILFPSQVRVSRVITVDASKMRIAETINDFGTWDKWNQFIRGPGLTNKSISSPSSGKGSFINADQARVTNTGITQDSIKTRWQQPNGKGFNAIFNLVQEDGNRVVIQWYFDFHSKWYPWEKLGTMFYDKQMGPLMEESLVNLKHLVENNY